MDEREAISRLKRGDISGLEALVRKYQVQAVWAAYLVSRDLSAAEDVVGTAFLRVYERIHQFDSSRPFGPWFHRIVVNDAVKEAKRQSRQVSLDRPPGADTVALADRLVELSAGPQELAERAETRREVWEAMGRLSPSQRAAIVARYYLGLKESEIAGLLGRAPGTIKKHLYDARGRLRTLLGGLRPGASRPVSPRASGGAVDEPGTMSATVEEKGKK